MGFLLDVSNTVQYCEYSNALKFINSIADKINLPPSGGRAAVTLFAKNAELVIKFSDFVTPCTFKQTVNGLDRTIVASDETNINFALNHALTQMFNVRNGMRPNMLHTCCQHVAVNKTLVLMTDGFGGADDDDYPKRRKDFFDAIKAINNVGIKVISIGIRDDVNEKGLMELSPNNYHFAETFEDLLNETFRASIHVCHGT